VGRAAERGGCHRVKAWRDDRRRPAGRGAERYGGIGRSGPPTANWEAAAAQAVAAPSSPARPLFPNARVRGGVVWRTRFSMHGLIVIKNAVLAEHSGCAGNCCAPSKRRRRSPQRLADA
jgi:hypothetical protein